MRRKKLFFIILSVLLVVGAALGVWVYLGNNKKTEVTTVGNVEETSEKIRAEQNQQQTDAAFNTPDLKSLNDAYTNKDYAAVATAGEAACKNATGDQMFYCYAIYAKALAKKGDFVELEALAEQMLTKEEVQNDTTLKNSWTNTRDSAKKGVDPESVKQPNEDEARN